MARTHTLDEDTYLGRDGKVYTGADTPKSTIPGLQPATHLIGRKGQQIPYDKAVSFGLVSKGRSKPKPRSKAVTNREDKSS